MTNTEHLSPPDPGSAREPGLFADRADAGAQLAARLGHLRGRNPLVIGLARGGVPVAREVARQLDSDLDVLVVRKLGAPGQPELAIGALTADGTYHLNRDLVLQLGVSDASVAHIAELQSAEALRLEQVLRGGRRPIDVAGRTVILVDDGLATGATMRVALHATALHGAKQLIVAVPVGARETCSELASLVDELVCLHQPEAFAAVGDHYADFEPTTDVEVLDILRQRAGRRAS
jgi:putative phosphoribosyl transferase